MIYLVVALRCEAIPFIHHYKLKQVKGEPYPIYEGEGVRLILSGVGQLHSACATTTLRHRSSISSEDLWVNIGLAGHPHFALGSVCLASKVSSKNMKRSFYPPLLFKTPLKRAHLISLDQPSQDYISDTLFDMEGYGFYFSALKYANGEQVQVCKVVSDHAETDFSHMTSKWSQDLIEQSVPTIVEYLEQLKNQRPKEKKHPELSLFRENFKFSMTELHRLEHLLNTLSYQEPSKSHYELFASMDDSKTLLKALESHLQKVGL